MVSVAWVGGPPLATLVIGALGEGAILWVIAGVSAAGMGTAALLRQRNAMTAQGPTEPRTDEPEPPRTGSAAVAVLFVAFALLQATNSTATSFMTVYTTQHLELPVYWGGIALGAAAALNVPFLILTARLGERHSELRLILIGAAAGVGYYAALALVTGPVMLIVIQVLNAWSFSAVAGTGLALFQRIVPRPGLATGLYMNTRRVGALISGPIIVLGATTSPGQPGIFYICASLTLLAAIATAIGLQRPSTPNL